MTPDEINNTLYEITQINELKDIHVYSDTNQRKNYDVWGWYTHTPFIYKRCKELMKQANVNILEIGMGVGSSSIFSFFAKNHPNFNVDSIETDYNWYNTCIEKYYSNITNIKYYYHESYDNKYTQEEFSKKYDLIFVDQGSWEDRNKSILHFLKNANSIIVHDYDYNLRVWPDTHDELLKTFANIDWDVNWRDLLLTNPPTIVCKN
jgi:hypothetical protein